MTEMSFEEFAERLERFKSSVEAHLSSPLVPPPPPSAVCETCDDIGWIIIKSAACPAGEPRVCPNPQCTAGREHREARSLRLLKRSGLPSRYAALTFETWYALPDALRAGKELAAACAWLFANGGAFSLDEAATALELEPMGSDERRAWVVLQGGLGVGKTGLAAAAMNEMALTGKAALYYRVGELFADIQSRYGSESGLSADDLLETVKATPVLILDEMNVPRASDDKQRIIEEIIRYRHGRDLPTLITCNVAPKEFTAMWGERTSDVVFEQAHWIFVRGERLRRSALVMESF